MSTALVEDYSITSDKLDEWKEVLPKAGPKFRLGKYFDTIYEIPEFDAIKEPEGGYLSCWDTDTDINSDDESNNFLFANVDGDSASVICMDDGEAMQLIRRWKASKETELNPMIDRESSTKPGSDGTYEIVDGDDIPPEEHIYESIDDCAPDYQLVLDNENSSPLNTPTHLTVTQRQSPSRRLSSPCTTKTKRSNSLPISSGSSPKFARKYSDCTEYTRLKRRQHTDSSCPPPLPPPNGSSAPYNSSTLVRNASSEYSQLYRLCRKTSSPNEMETKTIPSPPSMVLKHKGKSYVLPIVENSKRDSKITAVRRQSSQGTPKHSASFPSTESVHRYSVPRSVSMGFQSNKTVQPPQDNTTPKRKSKHNSTHSGHSSTNSQATCSTAAKSHVKLYGVF